MLVYMPASPDNHYLMDVWLNNQNIPIKDLVHHPIQTTILIQVYSHPDSDLIMGSIPPDLMYGGGLGIDPLVLGSISWFRVEHDLP